MAESENRNYTHYPSYVTPCETDGDSEHSIVSIHEDMLRDSVNANKQSEDSRDSSNLSSPAVQYPTLSQTQSTSTVLGSHSLNSVNGYIEVPIAPSNGRSYSDAEDKEPLLLPKKAKNTINSEGQVPEPPQGCLPRKLVDVLKIGFLAICWCVMFALVLYRGGGHTCTLFPSKRGESISCKRWK